MDVSNGISIVIPAYNEELFLPNLFKSIKLAKSYLGDERSNKIEIVVVDNNSTDRTAEVGSREGAKVIPHKLRNISSVRNAGIKHATYPIIVTVDADCLFAEDSLDEIWKFIQNDEYLGAALNVEVRAETAFANLVAKTIQSIVFKISGIKGAMFVFHKSAALEFGAFSEAHLVAEDSIFSLQMTSYAKSKNKKFGFLKSAKIMTLEGKQIKLTSLPHLISQTIKAFRGHKQTTNQLPFWYNPKR